jgi:crotonobetainyl-CoA:carnitine CoA-transferase CaiB-like acyl-CoA transferase
LQQPLEGLRVIDCGIYHAGPGAPALLGDLGAEVIKIEQPGEGDPVRRLTRVGSIPVELPGGRSLYCEGANRNKKSVTIDLKHEKGRDLLYRLVKCSDVFLTNMRDKAVENLGISYPVLSRINSRLVYATVSAFGPRGPDGGKGGFDYQGQARSGLMYSMGAPDMPPLVCQFGIIDQATALMASHQIVTALYMREKNGLGQHVHVSLLGTAISLSYFNVLMAQIGGFNPPRHDRKTSEPLRNYYECKDGLWLMMTLTPSDRFWPILCSALGLEEIEKDPRFDTADKRYGAAEELVALLDRTFATRPRDEWLRIMGEYDLFCCAVNSYKDLADDAQIIANGYLVEMDHPTLGRIKIPGYPGHFERARTATSRGAPELGEHTKEVLTTLANCSKEELEIYKKDGII